MHAHTSHTTWHTVKLIFNTAIDLPSALQGLHSRHVTYESSSTNRPTILPAPTHNPSRTHSHTRHTHKQTHRHAHTYIPHTIVLPPIHTLLALSISQTASQHDAGVHDKSRPPPSPDHPSSCCQQRFPQQTFTSSIKKDYRKDGDLAPLRSEHTYLSTSHTQTIDIEVRQPKRAHTLQKRL